MPEAFHKTRRTPRKSVRIRDLDTQVISRKTEDDFRRKAEETQYYEEENAAMDKDINTMREQIKALLRVDSSGKAKDVNDEKEGYTGQYTERSEYEKEGKYAIRPEDLHLTFENIVSVIAQGKERSLDKASVISMVKSLYEWIVFDPNMQIFLPVECGSGAIKKMWPHGSKIDTRIKRKEGEQWPGPMNLREVDKEYVPTVASSVVSSVIDENPPYMKEGSIMSSNADHQRLSSISYDIGLGYPASSPYSTVTQAAYTPVDSSYKPLARSYKAQPLPPHDYIGHTFPQQGSQGSSYMQQAFPPQSFPQGNVVQHTATTDVESPKQTSRKIQRFSIIGGPVPPPMKLEDTPQLAPAHVNSATRTRRPKVGATARANGRNDDDDQSGTPVVWESQ